MTQHPLVVTAERWISCPPDPMPGNSCAFVRALLRQHGIILDVLSIPALWSHAERCSWIVTQPQPGDLAVFVLNGQLDRAGLVRVVAAGKVSVVELVQCRILARTYDLSFSGIYGWCRIEAAS